ncbi:MAG TPA: VanZ family protein [Verrucomicrobiae bacterium]|jgi:VanZ family protein|nr:VanZ family protein [Verrucomicrobiae bacterium]
MGASRFCESPRFSRAVFALYQIPVFVLSLLRGDRLPPYVLDMNDKFLHAMEFGLFFLLAANALRHSRSAFLKARTTAVAVSWTLAVGGLIEVLQERVPGRTGDVADFIADAAGVALAYAAMRVLRSRRTA